MVNFLDGNCTLSWQHHNNRVLFDNVEINGKMKPSLANEYYDDITKKPTDNKTLIAILASCGALLIMICILAVCASHIASRTTRTRLSVAHATKRETMETKQWCSCIKVRVETVQHLTEELHTVENGYHDNPTLEVMEIHPQMQEKKMALNGDFNDSWIVPIDNLLKEGIAGEEDTHL
ncbi:podocalyxin [Pseudochaenichthys georgianus]|uniref:podocalyxin n=1 Tax=Pseudochaenichthys georgianus TaxID=52239 RepID=UPI0039C0D53E